MRTPKIVLLALLILEGISTSAQKKTEAFAVNLPEKRIANSLYNQIDFIDIRRDTSYFGMVKVGLGNARAKVQPTPPLLEQLQLIVDSAIDQSAQNNKLLFVLRRFAIKEVTSATKEVGMFYVRATLMAINNNEYRIVSSIDTVVQFNGMDVTKRLLRLSGKVLTHFITANLTKVAEEQAFTMADIRNIDSIQKMSIPLYVARQYKDGIYKTYDEFKNQTPIAEIVTAEVTKRNLLTKIRMNGDNNETLDENTCYAAIYQGIPYIITGAGNFPIEKKGNDFFYTGKMKVYNGGAAMAGALMFGMVGGLVGGSISGSDIVEFRLDHVSGVFVYNARVKK